MAKIKNNINLEWYVYYHDFNQKIIKEWNIFNHGTVKNKVIDLLNNKDIDKTEFAEKVKGYLLYHFWGKCEYEVVITPWIGTANDVKIDVYQQISMNYPKFIDYLWSFRK